MLNVGQSVGPHHRLPGKRNRAADCRAAWPICRISDLPVFHRRRGFGSAEDLSGAVDRRAVGRRTNRSERGDAASDAFTRQAGQHSSSTSKSLRPPALRHAARPTFRPHGCNRRKSRGSTSNSKRVKASSCRYPSRCPRRRPFKASRRSLSSVRCGGKTSGRDQAVHRLGDLAGKRRQPAEEWRLRGARFRRQVAQALARHRRRIDFQRRPRARPRQARAEISRLRPMGEFRPVDSICAAERPICTPPGSGTAARKAARTSCKP